MADSSEKVDILLRLVSQLEGATESIDFLKNFATAVTGVGLAFGAADIGSKIGELFRSSVEFGSSLSTMAARAQMSAGAFETLLFNATGFGVKQDDLVRGSVALQHNLEAAVKNGASPMNQALAALNLTAAGLQALAPERQFEVIGERIAGAADKNAAFAAAMDLMGSRSAPKLLEFLKRLGVEGFDAMAESVKKVALSDEQLATLDRWAAEWEKIKQFTELAAAHAGLFVVQTAKATLRPLPGTAESRAINSFGGVAQMAAIADEQRGSRTTVDNDSIQEVSPEMTESIRRSDEARHARESAMAKAESDAQLAALDKQSQSVSQRVDAFDQKSVNLAIAATTKAMAEQDVQLQKTAEKYIEASDPLAAFQRKLDEIKASEQAHKLTAEQAAAAIDREKFSLAGGFTAAIDDARRALLGYEDTANKIADNPFLTDEQKHQQRIALLKQENAEIERRIADLQKEMALHPSADSAGAKREIDTLSGRAVGNKKEIGAFDPATAGTATNLAAQFVEMQNKIRTPAQNIATTISGTIGNAFQTVQQNVTGLLRGTESWHAALQNVAGTIEGDLIGGIVKMFTEWVEQRAVAALASMAWSEAEGATDTAAKAPGALMSSISSYGVAAAVGLAAIVAAMASMSKFEVGGFTANIGSNEVAGVVHGGEWVAPNWMVNHPAFGGVIGALEGARNGSSSSAAGPSSAGKPQRVIHTVARNESHARQLFQDPSFHNELLRWHQKQFGF